MKANKGASGIDDIYEPIFSKNSYGFRPNKSAHDAVLKAKEIMNNGYSQSKGNQQKE